MRNFGVFTRAMYSYFLLNNEDELRAWCFLNKDKTRAVVKRRFSGRIRRKCLHYIGPDAFERAMSQYWK